MNLQEKYLGIEFSIRDNGDGTFAWALHPPESTAALGAGRVPGGQNEAILAARKAIGKYVGKVADLEATTQSKRRKIRAAHDVLLAKLDKGPLDA